MKQWNPPVATSRKEQLLLKRLTRTKKLFAFLRLHRHELFNDGLSGSTKAALDYDWSVPEQRGEAAGA